MNLSEEQKKQVAAWVNEGLKLSDIQKRLDSELGVKMTYMELRFLLDDLQLALKDNEPSKPEHVPDLSKSVGQGAPAGGGQPGEKAGGSPGGVNVSLDEVVKPGAVVSGSVTFSDGMSANWYLDQFGRLGFMPQQEGYQPSQADLQAFQADLQSKLQKAGF